MPSIDPLDRKRVFKRSTRHFERNAVILDIACGFDVVPLEFIILHNILVTISFINRVP